MLYLFHDAGIGGTSLYLPTRPMDESERMVQDTVQLDPQAFCSRWNIAQDKPGARPCVLPQRTRNHPGADVMFKPFLLMALLAGTAASRADVYTTLTLPTLNADLRVSLGGAAYVPLFPGVQNWTSVPFQLAVSAAGNTSFIDGVLDIPVDVFGVTQAYTLINSAFGTFGANNGSVEFCGTSAQYKVDLIQGQNIRDHLNNVFNNVIDGTSAVPAFVDGWARLDQQNYTLPAAFATQTLVSMRFTGINLGNPGGSAFINAATVAVTEPAGALLLVSGGAALLAWRRRAGA